MHTVLTVLAFDAATPAALQVKLGADGVGVGVKPASSEPPPPQAASANAERKRMESDRVGDIGSMDPLKVGDCALHKSCRQTTDP
jgi:pyridoxal biosynthesis lyase PdxS